MTRAGVDAPWIGPTLPPELDWQQQPDGVTVSVADVTPGYHAATGKVLAIGCRVRYSSKGQQFDDVKHAHQMLYAVLDPQAGKWTPWQVLELPDDEQFNFARNACAQWLVKPDGTLLVPLYIGIGLAANQQRQFPQVGLTVDARLARRESFSNRKACWGWSIFAFNPFRICWDGLSKVLQLGSPNLAFNSANASFGFAYLRPSEFASEDSGVLLSWNPTSCGLLSISR